MNPRTIADELHMKHTFSFFILASVVVVLSACNRDLTQSRAVVRVEIPKTLKKNDNGATSVQCFGINVTGPGIAAQKNSCSPPVGVHVGLVSGGTVTIDLERGDNRRIELYMMELRNATTCPKWDDGFLTDSKEHFGRMYRVAEQTVNLDQEQVSVTLDPAAPVLTQTLLTEQTGCVRGAIQAKLLSSGEILNVAGSGFTPDLSLANIGNVSKSDESATSSANMTVFTNNGASSGLVNMQFPPHVQSVSQKPDTKDYYGMLADGSIVGIDVTTGLVVALTTTTCPFLNCQVPVWAESISVGYGSDLFFKDHGGQLYKATVSATPEVLGTTVDRFVSQVVIY